jgi:hypothetical protein
MGSSAHEAQFTAAQGPAPNRLHPFFGNNGAHGRGKGQTSVRSVTFGEVTVGNTGAKLNRNRGAMNYFTVEWRGCVARHSGALHYQVNHRTEESY